MPKDPLSLDEKNIRILSVDGGGIYGLVSAIWLRQLCEQDEEFLTGKDIDVFAGISAGALMVLLLAKEECPRDFVLRGGLEKFWAEQVGVFSNEVDPVKSWLSLWNVGGWFGEADFLQQLDRHFGEMTFADLKHDVVISTFDWVGTPSPSQHSTHNPAQWSPWASQSFTEPWAAWASVSTNSNWRPRIFTRQHDKTSKVRDIAYAAATPAGFRAVRDGLSDAGIFAVSPSVHALSAILYAQQRNEKELKKTFNKVIEKLKRIQDLTVQFPITERGPEAKSVSDEVANQAGDARKQMTDELLPVIAPLQNISMLSVGNGSQTPAFWLRDFDLSSLQMSLVPTNPFSGHFYPPNASLMLDGLSGDVANTCKLVLGKRFHRLNAPLLSTPLLMATMLCRFPQWRQFFVQQIQFLTEQPLSKDAVDGAMRFLQSYAWFGEWQPLSHTRAPMEETLMRGLDALASMKRFRERNWAIGVNGDTLEPDPYFKYFRERGLEFRSYSLHPYGQEAIRDPSAYEENIQVLHRSLCEELELEQRACEEMKQRLLVLQRERAPIGFDAMKGPDEIAEFFALRNLKVRVDPNPVNTTAHETDLKELADYMQRLETYRVELERMVSGRGRRARPPDR